LILGNNGEKMLLTWGLMDSQIPGMPPTQFGSMELNCWCPPKGQRLAVLSWLSADDATYCQVNKGIRGPAAYYLSGRAAGQLMRWRP